MQRYPILWLLTLATVLTATPAVADGWALSAGVFDVAREKKPFEAGIELRARRFELGALPIQPAVGVAATDDGSVWLYGSLRYDLALGRRLVLTPQLGVALYEDGDEGKDLGGPIEFRSGLEIGVRLGERSRLGVLVYHLSNAGLYDDNPGSNSLVLVWSF